MASPIVAFSGHRRRVQIEASTAKGETRESHLCKIATTSACISTRDISRRRSAPRLMINRVVGGGGDLKVKSFIRYGTGRGHPAGWQPVIAYITRNDKRRCAAMIWKVGHPTGVRALSHPGVIKASQDIVRGCLWRSSYQKICSLRCRQMCLLRPVSARQARERMSMAGINSRQKEGEGEADRPVRYHYRP